MASPYYIAVGSCKGGVGKSTVAALLALSLRSFFQVGLLDADIYGPSLLSILGADLPQTAKPIAIEGVQCLSLQTQDSQQNSRIWRAPILHKAITSMLAPNIWENCEIVIIDIPPGTGDIVLSLRKALHRYSHIMVTTPHELSIREAFLFSDFCSKTNLPVLGSIVNMCTLYKAHPTLQDLLERHPKIASLSHTAWIANAAGSRDFSSNAHTHNKEFFEETAALAPTLRGLINQP